VDVLQLPVNGASVLATLSDGASVRLNAYSDAWALIETQDGTEGFIPRDALTLRADGMEDDGEIVAVDGEMAALLTEDAALYVNADDSVAPRRVLEKGAYVRVLAYNRAWACVRTGDGETGYVMLRALSAVQQSAEAEAADDPVTRVEGEVFRLVSADAVDFTPVRIETETAEK
jgi:SH3-like domain-containing protein